MKIIKKISVSLLAINFAFLGLGQVALNEVYAAEETTDVDKTKLQRDNLTYAISDSINVRSSESYNTYASEKTKLDYENAIENARKILDKGELASFAELAQATAKINEAKAGFDRDVIKAYKIKELRKALERNKLSVSSAKFLLTNAPNTVAKVKGKLEAQIKSAEAVIAKTEAVLSKVN